MTSRITRSRRQAGSGITMLYDGDGNRVSKTVAGVTTKYMLDTQNPTGYAQVVYEAFSGSTSANHKLSRIFVYGLERISQFRSYFLNNASHTQTSYYVCDGHGSTRALTDPNGNVTDTYDYDAFGNLLHSTATGIPPGGTTVAATPNEFLFAGEQFDSDLNLYYNRARYLNVSTGRFWTMDAFDGNSADPLSLHKYLYASSDPINRLDPSGKQDLVSELAGEEDDEILSSEDAQVKNEARKKVNEELTPEILIHGTSLTNAYSIDAIGLTAQLLPELKPGIESSGVFFVFAISTNRQFSITDLIQSALAFAADGFEGNLAYMIGKMPQPVWQGLTADKSVVPISFGPPGAATSYACTPASFPAIDEYNKGSWIIVPALR